MVSINNIKVSNITDHMRGGGIRKRDPDAELPVLIFGGDVPLHLFRQHFCDGESEPRGISGIFHGEEPVEQLFDLHLIQRRGGIAEQDLSGFG